MAGNLLPITKQMATKWNAKLQFPTDSDYINRIVGAEFAPSNSSDNPMVTLTYEVVTPAEKVIGTEKVILAGVKSKGYYVTTCLKGDSKGTAEEKTASARKRFLEEVWTRCGMEGEPNWDNIDVKPLLGKLVYCMMSPDVDEQTKNPTAEQLAKDPKAKGDVMRNPVTGQALVQYWPKVREIFGVAPTDGVNVAY